MRIPIFPLNTVLFPGGPLPLRIFEARYIDMISDRLRNDAPFGVVLIKDGKEDGRASTFDVGTLATITDWYQGSDGLLGITAIGGQRFHLLSVDQQVDGLNVGDVELLPMEESLPLPEEYQGIARILEGVLKDLGRLYASLDSHYGDVGWVTYRFVEVLPMDLTQKQACLENSSPVERLQLVRELLRNSKN